MHTRLSSVASIFALMPLELFAKCLLPIADGGGHNYVPSRPNVFGVVERVDLPNVYVKNGKTGASEHVSVSQISEIFSVYGGDDHLAAITPKLQVWIWFKDCKRSSKGPQNAAYFQIFSIDPNDRARLDRNGNIITVPPAPSAK
jgi:hypothetical protein